MRRDAFPVNFFYANCRNIFYASVKLKKKPIINFFSVIDSYKLFL